MGMTRVMIQLSPQVKAKLDALRQTGISTSAYVRRVIEESLAALPDLSPTRKER